MSPAFPALRCCWPDCRDWAPRDLTVPMCWRHARTVAEDFMRGAGLLQEAVERTETSNRERIQREGGDVYYLRVDGLIKIGYSRNVYTRMQAYPPTAELLAVERGTKQTERLRHGQFRADLEHGREWFRESSELSAWIDQVREQYGDPSERAYRYTTPHDRRETMRLTRRRR